MKSAIGEVAFGMSDGAVSVSGLVFGMAASTTDPHLVLLAGATGAGAGAVSMMAGSYLDAQSQQSRLDALMQIARERIAVNPTPYIDRAASRMENSGYSRSEIDTVLRVFDRNPDALLDHVVAHELGGAGRAEASPRVRAGWMFVADLLAAGVPVFPFALFDFGTARLVSLGVTGGLMCLLGVVRGKIGHVSVVWSAVQTMAIAGAAALAGIAIGALVTS